MIGLLGNPTQYPVPVTGAFPQLDFSRIPPGLLMEMARNPQLRAQMTMQPQPPIQQTPLGPVPGLLDQRLASPRPRSLLEPVADIIPFNRRGLLSPTTEMGPRGGRAAGGPGAGPPQMTMGMKTMQAVEGSPNVQYMRGRPPITEREAARGGVDINMQPYTKAPQTRSEQLSRTTAADGSGREPFSLRGYARELEKGGPEAASRFFKNAPLSQHAEKMEATAKQAEQAFRNKWSAWGHRNGWDSNETVRVTEMIRLRHANELAQLKQPFFPLSDDQIKFQLLMAKQKGWW